MLRTLKTLSLIILVIFIVAAQSAPLSQALNYNSLKVVEALEPLSQEFDLKLIETAMEEIIKSIRQKNDLPRINCQAPQANSDNRIIQNNRVGEAISPEINELTAKISQLLFGEPDAFLLVPSRSGGVSAYLYARTITIDSRFTEKLKSSGVHNDLFLTFTLAHEISHYLYEYFVRYLGNGKSPHGQPRNCGMIQVDYPTPIKSKSYNIRTWPRRDLDFASSRSSGMTHAEVDAFAVVILVKYLGYQKEDLSKIADLFDVLELPNLSGNTRIADIPDNEIAFSVQSIIRRRSFERTVHGF